MSFFNIGDHFVKFFHRDGKGTGEGDAGLLAEGDRGLHCLAQTGKIDDENQVVLADQGIHGDHFTSESLNRGNGVLGAPGADLIEGFGGVFAEHEIGFHRLLLLCRTGNYKKNRSLPCFMRDLQNAAKILDYPIKPVNDTFYFDLSMKHMLLFHSTKGGMS
jgi:hypothetical protein